MSIYVVGDIQGCLGSLKCVLKKISFNTDKDILWSVGDIVNRGPKSLKTLKYLYERRDKISCILMIAFFLKSEVLWVRTVSLLQNVSN